MWFWNFAKIKLKSNWNKFKIFSFQLEFQKIEVYGFELYMMLWLHTLQDMGPHICFWHMPSVVDSPDWWSILVYIQYRGCPGDQDNMCKMQLGFYWCTLHWYHKEMGDMGQWSLGVVLIKIKNDNFGPKNNNHQNLISVTSKVS